MVQTKGNERLTAFVSTMVAVAILAAGVTAHQSAPHKVTDVVQVASDLRFQLEMAFRHDSREQQARLAQLDAVMSAWNVAPQSDADRELLLAWLREAGTNSLPGVMQPLPAVPEFSSSDLVLAGVQSPTAHQVQKVVTSETRQSGVKQPEIRKNMPTEHATTAPTLGTLYAQGPAPAPTPVTPTPADPLEEEMIALRQPQSLTNGPRNAEPQQTAVAPRPGIAEQPKLVEQNLLASVPVPNSGVDTPVTVNLTELAARIAGYHDSLDEVELALLRMDTPDLAVVKEQVEKLEGMTRDYGFVQLYYDSLTPRERESILEPRSMQATLDEVTRQLKRCEEVRDGDYLGTLNGEADEEFADLRAKIAEIERRTER
jgi:hypothetical protein